MNPTHPFPALALLASLILSIAPKALAQELTLSYPEGSLTFTAAELLELSPAELRTDTPWTDEEQHFEGVLLADLLKHAGIESGQLAATALNGYSVDLPVEEAINAGAFIAVKANGEFMRVRDKGPFWIVFPWSKQSELENRTVRAWAIWQLVELAQDDQ